MINNNPTFCSEVSVLYGEYLNKSELSICSSEWIDIPSDLNLFQTTLNI